MMDYKKAFIDTAPFVYFIERDDNKIECCYLQKIVYNNICKNKLGGAFVMETTMKIRIFRKMPSMIWRQYLMN